MGHDDDDEPLLGGGSSTVGQLQLQSASTEPVAGASRPASPSHTNTVVEPELQLAAEPAARSISVAGQSEVAAASTGGAELRDESGHTLALNRFF